MLAFGAGKYAPRNWEQGITYSRVWSAAMRHLTAWWQGEDSDVETGLSHLAHAGCCVLFLLAFTKRGMATLDDRPALPSPPAAPPPAPVFEPGLEHAPGHGLGEAGQGPGLSPWPRF